MSKILRLVALSLVLLTTACGWQLRGAAGGGFNDVAIALEGAPGNRLLDEVAVELRRLGADVVASAAESEWVIRIDSAERTRRAVATDADGFVSEYELRYQLVFALAPGGQSGSTALGTERQAVQTTAAYAARSDNLQGQQAEEEQLERELREDAIRLMLARLGRRL